MKIVRLRETAHPVPPVRREVLVATPASELTGNGGGAGATGVATATRPPLLFVPGFGAGAWVYAENWLDHAAGRGYRAYAVSLRGYGGSGGARRPTLRAYVHDVVQAAVGLPRQAVLIGHGAGALVVARALDRYPARAAVLAAPVLGGPRDGVAAAGRALARNPFGTLPALVGAGLGLRRGQLFGRDLPAAPAAEHLRRFGRVRGRATWQLVLHRRPEPPVGDPPILVLGSPEDAVVGMAALTRAARRYQVAPLLFPGMGHALMLDTRWQEPLDAILDWLDQRT